MLSLCWVFCLLGLRVLVCPLWARAHSQKATIGTTLRRGLLLRDAVDVSAAERDLARLHADHAALGEHGLHLLHGERVVRVAVLRQDDAAVDDEEVHIRRDGDLAVLARDGALHGVDRRRALQQAGLLRQAELVHLQPAALGVRRLREHVVCVVRRLIERVLRVVRPDAGDLAGRDEAGRWQRIQQRR